MHYLVHHCVTGFLVFFYSLVALVPSCHAAKNLALGKSYTVSPLATYRLSAPPTDRTSLTDGVYTKGFFWAQKTTVGWWPTRTVEILIDLEKVSVIDSISFNTARGIDSGVYYPAQIHAFVGPDREHLRYVGDIASQPDNLPGTYRVHKFQLQDIRSKGRFVLLEIIASKNQGVYCDEVEVLEGTQDTGVTGTLTVEAARRLAGELKWPGIEQKMLNSFLHDNGELSAKQMLPDGHGGMSGASAAKESAWAVDVKSLVPRTTALQKKFPKETVLVESVAAWSSLSPFASVTGLVPSQLELVAPVGGYDHLALLITNLKSTSQEISVALARVADQSAALSVAHLPFVRSASLEYVADPWLQEGQFKLHPGESRVVFVSLRGLTPGNGSRLLQVAGEGHTHAIPLAYRVATVALPVKPTLNSVNWGYLNFSLISGRRTEAVKDLLAHHTNAVAVPPGYLTGANQKRQAGLQDFLKLESYLKLHRGADKVLLGLNFGTEKKTTVVGRFPFLSQDWQEGFKKWYAGALFAAEQAGFKEDQVYLYPYDEIGSEQIDDFIRLAVWAKKAIPTAKFYMTFGAPTFTSKRWNELVPYLSIIQTSRDEMVRGIDRSKTEAWFYQAQGTSRSLSPYSYYRLMSWKAFLHDFTGVGFWSYASLGPDLTAWKEVFDDYAVIYDGPGTSIISSRRWEAWRMGIEDYELLVMYSKAKGEKAAKELAASVFNHPEDTARADAARRKMLTELDR